MSTGFSVNKITLVGNIGVDPIYRTLSDGREMCNLSLCTTRSRKVKNSDEYDVINQWNKISIFQPKAIDFLKDCNVRSGAKIGIDGYLDITIVDGVKHTSVVVDYSGGVSILSKTSPNLNSNTNCDINDTGSEAVSSSRADEEEDEIPF